MGSQKADRARQEAEKKARQEAEKRSRQEAEKRARQEAERRAKKAKQIAERRDKIEKLDKELKKIENPLKDRYMTLNQNDKQSFVKVINILNKKFPSTTKNSLKMNLDKDTNNLISNDEFRKSLNINDNELRIFKSVINDPKTKSKQIDDIDDNELKELLMIMRFVKRIKGGNSHKSPLEKAIKKMIKNIFRPN